MKIKLIYGRTNHAYPLSINCFEYSGTWMIQPLCSWNYTHAYKKQILDPNDKYINCILFA